MGVSLTSETGATLNVNAWNWGVLHHVVAALRVMPDEPWAIARSGGVDLEPAEVSTLAEALEEHVLPCLRPGERMFFDGSVTDVPDNGTLYRDESELWRNYSLSREVLADVIAFLRGAAKGRVSIG